MPSPAPSYGPAPAHHDQSPRPPACPPPGQSRSPRRHAAAFPAAAPAARSAYDPRGSARSPSSQAVLSGCAWNTNPALPHQEAPPASTASRTTGASSALSYYYAGALLPARVKYGRDRILVDSRGARDLLQRGLGEAALR